MLKRERESASLNFKIMYSNATWLRPGDPPRNRRIQPFYPVSKKTGLRLNRGLVDLEDSLFSWILGHPPLIHYCTKGKFWFPATLRYAAERGTLAVNSRRLINMLLKKLIFEI